MSRRRTFIIFLLGVAWQSVLIAYSMLTHQPPAAIFPAGCLALTVVLYLFVRRAATEP